MTQANKLAQSILAPEHLRIIQFGLVGASGVVVNTTALYLLVSQAGLNHVVGSAIATEIAIFSNFLLNDSWTFKHASGEASWLTRAARYNVVCLGGLLITVGVLALVTHTTGMNYLVANLVAIAFATLWNYAANSYFTWSVPASTTSL